MKTVNVKGVNLSVLSLGTVQLGLNYGISNADGKPSQQTANAILDCAMARGINTLDTAGAYGDSEVVIGSWLRTVERSKRPFIVTKAANLDHSSLEALRRDLYGKVRSVYLQGLVFQDPARLDPRMEFARDTLEKFRGLCKKYSLSPAALALSYALSLPGVASLVLGSEKPEQVEQNAALLEQAVALSDAQMSEIRASFLDTPARVLNPSMWFNAC